MPGFDTSRGKKEEEQLFHHQFVNAVETYHMSPSLVFNLGQTSSKFVEDSRYTIAEEGSKYVYIDGSSDKRAIRATFAISIDITFLPMQLICGGKTEKVSLHLFFRSFTIRVIYPITARRRIHQNYQRNHGTLRSG